MGALCPRCRLPLKRPHLTKMALFQEPGRNFVRGRYVGSITSYQRNCAIHPVQLIIPGCRLTSDQPPTMTADTFPRIDHIIIAAKDVRVAAKHFLDTYGLNSAASPEPVSELQ